MLIVRPARLEDLDSFLELARLAGPGFTSLAVSDNELKERLEKSAKSFANPEDSPGDYVFLLMLEDTQTREVVGVGAIKSQVGIEKPFFNFKILNIIQSSRAADRHFNMEVMLLVNEYSGASEVGTLFVKSKMRGTGAGRLISQSRYMFIAASPSRFSETVISELRGRVDKNGYSPFWEALGRKFFKMDFAEADKITAETDNQFITDLMPKYPIYTAVLAEEGQAVIGKAHPDGQAARRLLIEEGFRHENCVDIFDGGPTMAVPRDQIRTVKDSLLLPVSTEDQSGKQTARALVSNNRVEDFRAVFTHVKIKDECAYLTKDTAQALNIKTGDMARIMLARLSSISKPRMNDRSIFSLSKGNLCR